MPGHCRAWPSALLGISGPAARREGSQGNAGPRGGLRQVCLALSLHPQDPQGQGRGAR